MHRSFKTNLLWASKFTCSPCIWRPALLREHKRDGALQHSPLSWWDPSTELVLLYQCVTFVLRCHLCHNLLSSQWVGQPGPDGALAAGHVVLVRRWKWYVTGTVNVNIDINVTGPKLNWSCTVPAMKPCCRCESGFVTRMWRIRFKMKLKSFHILKWDLCKYIDIKWDFY